MGGAVSAMAMTMADNESAAVGELVSLAGPAYQLAFHILGSADDAEDALQAAYANTLRNPPPPMPPDELRSWFLTVAANAARNLLKAEARRRRREAQAMRERHVDSQDQGVDGELIGALRTAMAGLDERQRLPLALCYEQGLSQRQAAAVLGVHVSTVSERLEAGLAKLKNVLSKAGYAAGTGTVLVESLKLAAPEVPAGLAATAAKWVAAGLPAKALATAGGAATAKTGATAATGAAVGGLALGWKVVAGLSLAAAVGFLVFEGLRNHQDAPAPEAPPPAVAPAAAPGSAEEELEAILARPAAIRLSNESPGSWLSELVSLHDLDCAYPGTLWTWDARITVSHKGTVRECLEKLAEASGTKVSFDAGLVRFWRPADSETLKALATRLASEDEQERCVAVWRLTCLGDPETIGLVLKPVLEDPSPAVRYWAVRGLERLASDSGAPPLLPLDPPGIDREKWVGAALASDEWSIRLLAIWAAGVWRVLPDGGAPLMACLAGRGKLSVRNGASVRAAAAWALGRCRLEPAREPLVEFLCKTRTTMLNDEVQASARAIDRLGLRDLPDRLLRQVQDGPDVPVRTNAIHALGELRWAPAEAAVRKAAEEDANLRLAGNEALARIAPAREMGVAELELAAAQNNAKDWQACRAAFQQLEEIGTPDAREALVRLADKNIHDAGAALIRLGDERAADLVLKRAAEAEGDKRWVAIQLIPRLPAATRNRQVVEMLSEALTSSGNGAGASMTRQAAATALGELGDEAAVPLLAEVCRGKDAAVYGPAAKALGRIGTLAARDELLKLWAGKAEPDAVKARDEVSKMALRNGLVGILDKPGVLEKFFAAIKDDRAMSHNPCFSVTYTPQLADALARFLDNPDRKLRMLAVRCLGEWGLRCPEGVPAAIRLLGELDQAEDVRGVAMALGSFGGTGRADPRAAAAALRLLAEKRDRPGAEDLCDLLGKGAPTPENVAALMGMAGKDNAAGLRSSAVKGLGSLDEPGVVDLLVGIVDEPNDEKDPQVRAWHRGLRLDAADALGRLGGPRAVEPLLKMLRGASAGSKGSLINHLARIGDERAAPALLKELQGGDKFYRRWTASALERSPLAARPEVTAALEEYRKRHPEDNRPAPMKRPAPEPGPIPTPEPEVF